MAQADVVKTEVDMVKTEVDVVKTEVAQFDAGFLYYFEHERMVIHVQARHGSKLTLRLKWCATHLRYPACAYVRTACVLLALT